MAVINFIPQRIPNNLWIIGKSRWFKFKVTILSLFYHEHLSSSYISDILMEPILWFVDNFTKCLGPIFVVAVVTLTASVIFICYSIGLPYWWSKDQNTTIVLLVVGHWLLLNVAFHYYMGCTVPPGLPPEGALIPEAVSICKKCIAPKPPRTHHCSVCNKCILKMDHHCPWLNNCVGFYNHRHFFLYMLYTTLGVLFIIIFGFDLFLQRVWYAEEELVGHPVRVNNSEVVPILDVEEPTESHDKWERRLIIYMAFLCCGVFIALGTLCIWHARLISKGETSIEGNINKAETKRYAERNEIYINPYDLGWRQNWSYFLGVDNVPISQAILWVILPSAHSVTGDGLTWQSIFSDDPLLMANTQ